MSDFERGKYYGKKKYNQQRGDRSDGKSGYGSRFFNKSVYNPDKDGKDSEQEPKLKVKQPQILIKTREKTEERSVSPKRSVKEAEPSAIAQKDVVLQPSEVQNTTTLKTMVTAEKFLDENVLCTENIQDYLSESSDFLVVGIIGPQGVGKSTVMNLLAAKSFNEDLKRSMLQVDADYDDDGIKKVTAKRSSTIFQQATIEEIEGCGNTTSGIDFFITENRVILLDCQPFLSLSSYDEFQHADMKRSSVMADYPLSENAGELHGLQHIAFLMSVCHVLIFTQDFFFDSNNIRFLLTAEMLRPTISNNEDEYSEQCPHLLILHNRAQMEDFSPMRFKTIQETYRKVFSGTKMHMESSMGMGTGRIMPSLNPDFCGEPINLFLLPDYSDTIESVYKGHPPFEDLVNRLKMNVNCVTKNPITHVQLTEKTWLVYCSKVWEHVRKSSFYVEYTKLLP